MKIIVGTVKNFFLPVPDSDMVCCGGGSSGEGGAVSSSEEVD